MSLADNICKVVGHSLDGYSYRCSRCESVEIRFTIEGTGAPITVSGYTIADHTAHHYFDIDGKIVIKDYIYLEKVWLNNPHDYCAPARLRLTGYDFFGMSMLAGSSHEINLNIKI